MERAFLNRTEAGRLLAEKLEKYANRNEVVVTRVAARRCPCCLRSREMLKRAA